MGRPHRAAEGGYVYHVLNRANARMTIFEDDGDDAAFEKILQLAVARFETRLLVYCVTTGTSFSGRELTANCLGSSAG